MAILSQHAAPRLAAIALAWALGLLLPSDFHYLLVLSLGFGHYFASLVYARARIARIGGSPATALSLLAALAPGAGLYALGAGGMVRHELALLLFFCVHHACNEVYLPGRVSPAPAAGARQDPTKGRRFPSAAVVFHAVAYLAVLSAAPPLRTFDLAGFLAPALALSFAGLVACFLPATRGMTAARRLDAGVSEGVALVLGAAVLAGAIRIDFLDVVCYHFLFWFLYPLPRLRAGGWSPVAGYLGVNGISTAFAWCLSPFGVWGQYLNPGIFVAQFYLWSYVHISSSFALSSAHPAWIVRWFQGRPAPGGADGRRSLAESRA